MATTQLNSKISLRNASASEWSSINPVLLRGEMGIEIDTNKFKFGDGTLPWNELPYGIATVSGTVSKADEAAKVTNKLTAGSKSYDGSSAVTITLADLNGETAFSKNTAFNKNFETSTTNIKVNGTAAVGTSSNIARADHVHPTDTSRLSKAGDIMTGPLTLNAAPTNDLHAATKGYVDSAVNSVLGANDAMVFKGTLGVGGTITALPTANYSAGWTYKVITAGTYAGITCEVGDLIMAITDRGSTGASNNDWTVIQSNIDGAVTGPSSSVADHVATFNGASGKVIKDSGFTIATSVPSGAKFTDTVYTHPTNGANTSKGPTANATLAHGGSFVVPSLTVDNLGHTTVLDNKTLTLPAGYVHPNHTGDVTSTGDGATVIGTGKVTTTKIADLAVTTGKIADKAVTDAKITSMNANKLTQTAGDYLLFNCGGA